MNFGMSDFLVVVNVTHVGCKFSYKLEFIKCNLTID